ncbi:type 1 periplasmic binding fold superfamily protein [Flavobacterium litorale]|uniref:Type 1 periplasmic binding fold superfamily protein n=1 Tax=Flavobacterium litorale TaxID=2856519 RepID=A0ABX8V7G6_9FLAO|nr:type 1 periplasmic binding fold superfamily protein [Flavobacterium litorale]QYJ68761.1 type 1 periplasmic binding fold superfamily protein [Flavobacterium litorale]
MKNVKLSILALIALTGLNSCNNDDDATIVNPEEVITTLTATFEPVAGGETVVLTSRDLDGDGPEAPIISVLGNFTTGASYSGTVSFLNETETPAENVSEEILTEGDEHQIFFQQDDLGTFTYTDADVNQRPIGLTFSFVASTTPQTGLLTITLRHEPNKAAAGVADGDITNAGGESEAMATFEVSVVAP